MNKLIYPAVSVFVSFCIWVLLVRSFVYIFFARIVAEPNLHAAGLAGLALFFGAIYFAEILASFMTPLGYIPVELLFRKSMLKQFKPERSWIWYIGSLVLTAILLIVTHRFFV